MMLDLNSIRRAADELDGLCGDDDALFHDMMQGETDIDRICSQIWEQIATDEEMLVGITERQRALADRKKRKQDRIAGAKSLIGKVLRAGRLTKLELPEVTLSVRAGRPTLKVVDEDAVPADFQRVKASPDMAAIKDGFSQAETLPNWLTWNEPGEVVTARTK